jgi:O-antigen/teichoic acid export membrane protein
MRHIEGRTCFMNYINKKNLKDTRAEAEVSPDHTEETDTFRAWRMKLAVVTSIISKVMTVIVQVIATPVAINALGVEQYGVFVTLTAVLAWMSIANAGLVPGLTRGIAISVASDDRASQERYLSSAFFLISGIASVLLALLVIVLWGLPVESLFGNRYADYTGEIRRGLLWLGLIFILRLTLSVVEAARQGYQEQYINNLSMVGGNALSMVLLFTVAYYWPTIVGMTVAIYGTIVLAQLLNGVHLVGFSRSFLVPRFRHFDFVSSKILLSTGSAFFIVQMSSFVGQELIVLLVGRDLGPESAGTVAVMLRLLILCGGVVAMVTLPLWPAITDAVARGNIDWVRSTYKKLTLFSVFYSVSIGVMIAIFGNTIVHLWIGPEVSPSGLLQSLIGLYFVLAIWSHVNFMTLVGLGWLWPPAVVLLIESLAMIAMALWFMDFLDSAGAAAALCLSNICFSGWMLPIMVKIAITRTNQEVTT